MLPDTSNIRLLPLLLQKTGLQEQIVAYLLLNTGSPQ